MINCYVGFSFSFICLELFLKFWLSSFFCIYSAQWVIIELMLKIHTDHNQEKLVEKTLSWSQLDKSRDIKKILEFYLNDNTNKNPKYIINPEYGVRERDLQSYADVICISAQKQNVILVTESYLLILCVRICVKQNIISFNDVVFFHNNKKLTLNYMARFNEYLPDDFPGYIFDNCMEKLLE